MLEVGIEGVRKIVVTDDKTAVKMGSGNLSVFATPAMIALMEETAYKSVEKHIGGNESTVGTKVDIRHLLATAVGKEVKCVSRLMQIDNKKLVFEVKAFDDNGLIGEGTHERFIVDKNRFMEKVEK